MSQLLDQILLATVLALGPDARASSILSELRTVYPDASIQGLFLFLDNLVNQGYLRIRLVSPDSQFLVLSYYTITDAGRLALDRGSSC